MEYIALFFLFFILGYSIVYLIIKNRQIEKEINETFSDYDYDYEKQKNKKRRF